MTDDVTTPRRNDKDGHLGHEPGAVHSLSLPKPKNSAGRDVPKAVAVGVGLGAVVLACVFIPFTWYVAVSVAVAVACHEVLTRLKQAGYIIPSLLIIVGAVAMVWSTWFFDTTGLVSVFVTAVLALMFARLFHHGAATAPVNYLRDMSAGIFVLVWIPLFASFAAMLARISSDGVPGSLFIVTFMLCVIASDVGGYASGVCFGSHPMAPAVSPKKSWEGFAGSIVCAVVVGSVMSELVLHDVWWRGALMGLGLAVCATLGDLVESQFKRELGIKDMSNLLPGHGGLMDRLDGMLPAAMVTWVFMTVMATNIPV